MDDRVFRNTMGKFATGVTVITTKVGKDVHGMTANAFMSVSLDPKLITISIDNKANMLEKIKKSGQFAVSMLGEEQQDISMHFAGQKTKEEGIEFDLVHNVPIVRDALANVVCDVYDSYVVGDHTLFIGKVFEIALRDGSPLAFYQGKYGNYRQLEYSK
ncbi:flavin reductase family protein [Virgibacillus alimentarius]|uniref:Flavin reductase (DIM6/NTAB) family NADH-FMN oxidoreductase RutF n=1 Tax=Virgibacillus alimentarius TaxID=698769 RepID=A0ABS4SAR5_9BACI|nr:MULTISPECIES: flavin reductase family protein [Virgibacillus]MBP2258595.1 flavin reductase (DIM6/NTAB) family NADH-FMN oxidoreductase RutF [Virgibacillus alimentarius]HLR66707.1 flavin reductase family protein [Virgibacillus sp.]